MINLTKDAPKISLEKESVGSGQLRVNLNWSQPPKKSGLWAAFSEAKNLDLDLGCLYELTNGRKGVVQALGDSFGDLYDEPYIELDEDDRSGESTDGENLFVNMENIKDIKRLVFFTFIYEGAPSWDVARGIVTVYPPVGEPITVKLDAAESRSMCAIASVTVTDGNVSIQREVRYFDGHEELDRAYGWKLRWSPGTKD